MAKVVIANLDRCIKRLDKIGQADMFAAVARATLLVSNAAKANAPVDKGNLRSQIHATVDKKAGNVVGTVLSSAEYAMYVEFGTGIRGTGSYPYDIPGITLEYHPTWAGMAARPYMYPALNDNREKINKILAEGINEANKKAVGGG